MSQFDLFAEPTPPSVVMRPPAIIIEGDRVDEHPLAILALRTVHSDWLDVKITDAEFAAAREQYSSEVTDDYVMLKLIEARGVRTKPCSDRNLPYLYDYVEAPFVIRKRTAPGFAVTCRQAPKEKPAC